MTKSHVLYRLNSAVTCCAVQGALCITFEIVDMCPAAQIIAALPIGSVVRRSEGVHVSLQIAILKVLASYSRGHASVDAIKVDLAILAGAGPEWDQRLKRLAAKAPGLDIFGQHLVLREDAGWTLTSAGAEMLRYLEARTPAKPILKIVARSDSPAAPAPSLATHRRLAVGALKAVI